jgi:hypothetical protein
MRSEGYRLAGKTMLGRSEVGCAMGWADSTGARRHGGNSGDRTPARFTHRPGALQQPQCGNPGASHLGEELAKMSFEGF